MLRYLLMAMLAVALLGCTKNEPYSDLDNTTWFDQDKGNTLEFRDDGTVKMSNNKSGHSETYEYVRLDQGLKVYKDGTKDTAKPLFIFGQRNPTVLADAHYGMHFVRQSEQ